MGSVCVSVYAFYSYEGATVLSQARLCKAITTEKKIIEKCLKKKPKV